jgi:hypothetical protein
MVILGRTLQRPQLDTPHSSNDQLIFTRHDTYRCYAYLGAGKNAAAADSRTKCTSFSRKHTRNTIKTPKDQ